MRHQIIQMKKLDYGTIFKIIFAIAFEEGWIEQVQFHVISSSKKEIYQMRHVKNENDYAYFETIVTLETSALYRYYFSFVANGKYQCYKKQNTSGITSVTMSECWKMSVGFDVPEWAKGATMYHIFVDKFRRSQDMVKEPMTRRKIHENWYEPTVIGPDETGEWNIDFHCGDLKGIKEALDYISKLGVDILYLSPVVRSQSNHRYDTADYENVDPYAGTNEVLKELCEEAHKKGMKVILDAVFNHTGNDSIYFNQFGTYPTNGAWQGEFSPYYAFYKKVWVQGRKDFAYWWGMKNLPECNGNSTSWREFIFGEGGVIDKWFALGIDGLRLDVADELTDDFIEGINRAVKRNKPDGFILGEVWKNPMRMNRGYISSGKGMHSVMNYLLVDALIQYYKYCDVWKLDNILKEILAEYPIETIQTLMNFTSTHDISRAIEIFGCNAFEQRSEWGWNLQNNSLEWIKSHHMTREEYKYGKMVYKSYVVALAFMPGIFSIFYGDEVGLQGIGNLANRAPFPWNRMDKDLLYFFREIGKIRKEEKFMKKADIRILKIDHEQFVYERYDKNNKILVITSRTHHSTKVNLPEEYSHTEIIFSTKGSDRETLAPYGALVFKKN